MSAIIGTSSNKRQFVDGLVLQMLAYHSYEDLRIVVFTNEKNVPYWEYLKVAPHTWSNDRAVRYFATNLDEAKENSKVVVDASRTLLDIVNGILDISKIEANKLEIVNTEYDFRKILTELVSLTRVRIGDKPIEFITNFEKLITNVGILIGFVI